MTVNRDLFAISPAPRWLFKSQYIRFALISAPWSCLRRYFLKAGASSGMRVKSLNFNKAGVIKGFVFEVGVDARARLAHWGGMVMAKALTFNKGALIKGYGQLDFVKNGARGR